MRAELASDRDGRNHTAWDFGTIFGVSRTDDVFVTSVVPSLVSGYLPADGEDITEEKVATEAQKVQGCYALASLRSTSSVPGNLP
jgi:hypothetical protein